MAEVGGIELLQNKKIACLEDIIPLKNDFLTISHPEKKVFLDKK